MPADRWNIAVIALVCALGFSEAPAAASTFVNTDAIVTAALPASTELRPSYAVMPRTAMPLQDNGAFGSAAIPVGGIAALGQWPAAATLDGLDSCAGVGCLTSTQAVFAATLTKTKRLAPFAMLDAVNRAVNQAVTYRSEQRDHWASAAETARLGYGDCEDYAIAKLALLIAAGFDPGKLQFVVLQDTRRGLQHAVLVAHLDGRRYVLDNLSNNLAEDSAYWSYRPIASIVGDHQYLHGFAAVPTVRMAENAFGTQNLRAGFGIFQNWLTR